MDQKDKQTETNNLNTTQNQTKQELYVDDCPKIVYNFNTNGLSKVIAKKVENLVQILNNEVINLPRLKERLAEGIPDEANLIRQYSWKLALGYLPPQKSKWQQTITKQEATYRGLVQHFLPSSKFQDYPLIVKKGYPRFQQLQADFLLWEQIQKDTSRTHSQFTFFSTETHQMMLPYLTSARRQKFKLINGQNEEQYKKFLNDKQKQRKTYRYDYMSRILYIYSRLNPRIQYVQGMNQILAPIFYLLNASKPKNYIDEAACFYLFNNVISDIIDVHIKDLDKSQNGVYGRLNEVNQILVVIEPLIWNRLQKLKIDPFFYSFRWVTLLYAQDFELFDIMRIWESMFAVEERIKYINFIAIAIIITCKETILNNGFAVVLEHLQNIKENTDINQVIKIATQLYLEYKDKDFNTHAKKNKKALKEGENEAKKEQEKTRQGKEGNLFKRVSNFLGKYLE